MNTLPPLLCAAANTEVPCYLALLEKGYAVDLLRRAPDAEVWSAAKAGQRFQAGSLVELLGLVGLVEAGGAAWQASDADIDAFLHKYGA